VYPEEGYQRLSGKSWPSLSHNHYGYSRLATAARHGCRISQLSHVTTAASRDRRTSQD